MPLRGGDEEVGFRGGEERFGDGLDDGRQLFGKVLEPAKEFRNGKKLGQCPDLN
jgi:hypothetical protein